jgi:hypothetical protein
MSTPTCIVIAALIISAAILATQRYEIEPSHDADGKPFVWRMDRLTGEIESCALVPKAKWTVQCGAIP